MKGKKELHLQVDIKELSKAATRFNKIIMKHMTASLGKEAV